MATIKNIRVDKMRYQQNKLAYWFVLLAMSNQVVSLFATIIPRTIVPSFTTAIEILINITLLLLSFLAAEKVKAYNIKWAYGLLIISFCHLLRIFYEPLKLFRLGQISGGHYFLIIDLIIGSIVLLLVASFITIKKHRALMAHLKELGE
jgi:hypothetical protein